MSSTEKYHLTDHPWYHHCMIELLKADERLVPDILDYYIRNREFLAPYESRRDDSYYTPEMISKVIKDAVENEKAKRGVRFYITLPGSRTVIGTIALNNIVWGAFRSCFLGYGLDKNHLCRGYMTEAVNRVTEYAFSVLGLHRIEANVMPRNAASRRVLEKCGFESEGLARKYLLINGVWEDHIHMVKFAPEPPEGPGYSVQ